ncbi:MULTISPECIES: hypothetical protein [Peribacillus]|uniref:hypothetical protein n=1 Tax=Peribacillus TaxID=2675229 RepID=UPI001070F934|nr:MULTISPECIES: hypothetical protein [Peribacillus]MDV7763974.1 hypothetical protein [Peribacillus sp. CSMR9]TFH61216.1 hypothetical protein E4J71_12930 [Peribacillus frigoritolerans]
MAQHTCFTRVGEERLGNDPVIKDPKKNHSRLYDHHQMERIQFLHAFLEEQKKKGIKRTDREEV